MMSENSDTSDDEGNKLPTYFLYYYCLFTYFVFNQIAIKVLPQLKIVKSSQTVLSEPNIVRAIRETSTEPQYTELSELNNVNSITSSSRANELLSIPVSHHFNMSEVSSVTTFLLK